MSKSKKKNDKGMPQLSNTSIFGKPAPKGDVWSKLGKSTEKVKQEQKSRKELIKKVTEKTKRSYRNESDSDDSDLFPEPSTRKKMKKEEVAKAQPPKQRKILGGGKAFGRPSSTSTQTRIQVGSAVTKGEKLAEKPESLKLVKPVRKRKPKDPGINRETRPDLFWSDSSSDDSDGEHNKTNDRILESIGRVMEEQDALMERDEAVQRERQIKRQEASTLRMEEELRSGPSVVGAPKSSYESEDDGLNDIEFEKTGPKDRFTLNLKSKKVQRQVREYAKKQKWPKVSKEMIALRLEARYPEIFADYILPTLDKRYESVYFEDILKVLQKRQEDMQVLMHLGSRQYTTGYYSDMLTEGINDYMEKSGLNKKIEEAITSNKELSWLPPGSIFSLKIAICVPETAIRLMMEDLDVTYEEADNIRAQSAEWGKLVDMDSGAAIYL